MNLLKLESQYEERERKCVGSAGKELALELEGCGFNSDVQIRAAIVGGSGVE